MAEAFLSRVLRPMVSRALKRALGGFFDLEQTAELELSALKGVLALSDVKIQKKFSIPGLELVEGVVGRLELRIPWQRLSSEPVQVIISNASLVFRLASTDENVADVVKKQRLRAAELLARAEDAEDEAIEVDDDPETASHLSDEKRRRWIDRVLENIAFSIEGLKIRVLAPVHMKQEISLTLTIDSISLETTDVEGKPAFVTRQDELAPLHRRGLIRGFSIQMAETSQAPVGSVIIEPMWLSCLLEDRSRKRRVADCRMGPVRMRMAPNQLKWLLMLARPQSNSTSSSSESGTSSSSSSNSNNVLVPTSPRPIAMQKKTSLKSWVLYAISMSKLEKAKSGGVGRKKLGWVQFCERARDRSRYIQLYKRRLVEMDAMAKSSKKEASRAKMSEADCKELDRLEKKLPLSVVLLFRSFAEAESAYVANIGSSAASSSVATTTTSSSVVEKKKSSRFAVIAKIKGRLKRKKSSQSETDLVVLSTVEKQKLYEEILQSMSADNKSNASGSGGGGTGEGEEDRSTGGGTEMDAFGSSFFQLRASSLEVTLLRTGSLSDSAFLRLKAREVVVDAGFFMDTRPEIDFSCGKLECVDELTEAKVLTFVHEGYRVERARRLSGSNAADSTATSSKKTNTKVRQSFHSKHLGDWKEDESVNGGEEPLAKVYGRIGGVFKIAPVKLNLTPRLLEDLKAFIPKSSEPGKPMTTRLLFQTPKVGLFPDGETSMIVPIVSFDADSIDWCGSSGTLMRCGISFGSNPRCLPLDIAMYQSAIDLSLSDKEKSSNKKKKSQKPNSEDDANRIRLEMDSSLIQFLLNVQKMWTTRNDNGDTEETTISSSQKMSRKNKPSLRLFSPLEIAVTDLKLVLNLDNFAIQNVVDDNLIGRQFQCTRLHLSSLGTKRRNLVCSLGRGLNLIRFDAHRTSPKIVISDASLIEDEQQSDEDSMMMQTNRIIWDAMLFRELLGSLNALRQSGDLEESDDEQQQFTSLQKKNGGLNLMNQLEVDLSCATLLEFPEIDSNGTRKGENKKFSLIHCENGISFKQGMVTCKGPIVVDSFWNVKADLNNSEQREGLKEFLRCEEAIQFTLPSQKVSNDGISIVAKGKVMYRHFQTLGLEWNDFFQTQIVPLFHAMMNKNRQIDDNGRSTTTSPNGNGPIPFSITCLDGFLLELYPAALPCDVTEAMDRFEVESESLELRSTKKVNGKDAIHTVLKQTRVSRVWGAHPDQNISLNEDDLKDVISTSPLEVKVDWLREDLPPEQAQSVVSNVMVKGVRKDGPFATKRKNSFIATIRNQVSENTLTVNLSRETVRIVPLLLGENLQDFRRMIRMADDPDSKLTAAKWTSVLPAGNPFMHRLTDNLIPDDEFVLRELTIDLAGTKHLDLVLKMTPNPTQVIVHAESGLTYKSKEVRSLANPHEPIRTSTFALNGYASVRIDGQDANSGVKVDGFSLSRCSMGWNKDELHEAKIGTVSSQNLLVFPVLVNLGTFLRGVDRERERMLDSSIDPNTDRWAKHFRFVPATWKIEQEKLSISIHGSLLQSRKRSEMAYMVQTSLDQPNVLDVPIAFRVDGMHSSTMKQHSILCDPVRVHTSLPGLTAGVQWARDTLKEIRSHMDLFKEAGLKRMMNEHGLVPKDAFEVEYEKHSLTKSKPDLLLVTALRSFQFTLLTSSGKPCIRAFASKTIFRGQFRSQTPDRTLTFTFFDEDGLSGLGLGLSYFNQSIVKWEPMMEQAVLNLDLKWNNNTMQYNATVESTDPIRLNLTVAACEAIKRLRVPMVDSSKSSETEVAGVKSYSEWIFENDSGEDVVLELDGSDPKVSYKVTQGSSIPLRGFDSTSETRTATIYFASAFHCLRMVPLNVVGYFVLPLYPKVLPGQQRQTRLVQVSLSTFASEGSMVVRLCSSVAVENATGVPLEILLMPTPQEEAGEELTGRSALLGPLLPDKSLSLPVQSLTTRLSIRPATSNATYAWWTGMSVYNLKSDSMSGVCEASGEGSDFAFVCCVQDLDRLNKSAAEQHLPLELTSSTLSKREGRFKIIFLPAVTVINALPIELDYRFVGHNDRTQLLPGQRGKAHDPATKLLFRVSMSAWSEPVSFSSSQKETTQIVLEDSQGKHLKLLVECKPGPGGAPRLTVFAKAWFLNRSGLPLAYRVGDTGLRLFDTKSGQGLSSMGNKSKALLGEDELSMRDFKLGSACEFLVGETWMQVVIVGFREQDQSFEVFLTDNGVKVGGVKPSQLRRKRMMQSNGGSTSDAASGGDGGGGEYVLFAEQSGTLQVKVDSSAAGSMWSHPFSIENVGTDGVLALKRETYPPSHFTGSATTSNVLGSYYVLGVHVGSSLSADLKPTPVVTLVPRHILVNNLEPEWGLVLESDLGDASLNNRISVTEERLSLHCSNGRVRFGLERLVDFASRVEHPTLTRSGFKLSGVVDISKPCQESLKLQNKRSGECIVLKITVDWLDSKTPTLVCTVSRSKSSSEAFYCVVNETKDTMVHYYQMLRDPQTLLLDRKGGVERIFAGESKEFGWDEVDTNLPSNGAKTEARVVEFDFGGGLDVLQVKPDDLSAPVARMGKYVIRTIVQGITKCVVIGEEELLRTWSISPDPPPDQIGEREVDGMSDANTIVDEEEEDAWAGFEGAEELKDVIVTDHIPPESLQEEEEETNETSPVPEQSIAAAAAKTTTTTTSPNTTLLQTDDQSKSAATSSPRLVGKPQQRIRHIPITYNLALRFSSLCISFVDAFPQELAALHVTKFDATFMRRLLPGEKHEEEFGVAVSAQYVQLDNCTLNARLPVVVWPTSTQNKFLQAVISGRLSPNLIMISKLTVNIAPFDFYCEERVLLLALRMVHECKQALRRSNNKLIDTQPIEQDVASSGSSEQEQQQQKKQQQQFMGTFMGRTVFVEKAKIEAIALTITIQRLVNDDPQHVLGFPKWRGPGTAASEAEDGPSPVESILALLPSAFTDVDRASISLHAYEARRLFAPLRQLVHETKRRYSQELLSNVYRILSTELMRIVSPIGSALRVEDASSGLLQGAYGALDAASKVSGAIGTTAAFLSLDSKFVSSRRQALIDERPDGLGAGVVLGAKAIGTGIVMGLTGVVTQPVYGATEGGVAGFVAGVGKGIVGVGVKPVVGVFDMVANVLAGARSATAWLDPSETPRRARLPRTFGGEARALQPFDARAALVQDLLVKLWGVDRWREAAQGDFSLEYRLIEEDSLILVRVDTILVCVDFGSYSQVFEGDRVDLGSFNAAKPVLAWEVNGRTIESFEIDPNDGLTVRVKLQFYNKSGVVPGYGRAGGLVTWTNGAWILTLPCFSEESLGYLCRALQRVMFAASSSKQALLSDGGSSGMTTSTGKDTKGFGLSTISQDGRCVVSGVLEGSLAQKSGFLMRDVIIGFFGRQLSARDSAGGSTLHLAIANFLENKLDGAIDVLVERAGVTKRLMVVFNQKNESLSKNQREPKANGDGNTPRSSGETSS